MSVLDFLPVAEHAAIHAGTSNYDCTAGIQKAIDTGDRVYVPPGVYLTKQLNLKSGIEFYGAGPSSELRVYDATTACQFLLATHVRDGGTENTADNLRNIHIHGLKLNGRVAELGYSPFFFLLAVNATSDMKVEQVTFYGFRGDGMYVGSGTLNTTKRFNQRILVRDCLFDGAVKNNRNGLSVIDCDGLIVDSCIFQNIGNSKLSASVGGIDFEPDHNWSIYRDVSVRDCKFRNIDSTNTAGITFHNAYQVGQNMHDWEVIGCQFDNCYWGIASSAKPKNVGDVEDNLTISHCHFLNSVRTDVAVNGLNGTRIMACIFERLPPGAGKGGDAIRLGTSTSARSSSALNAVITGNMFSGIHPQLGVIGVIGVNGLVCAGNSFTDIVGTCISFPTEDMANTAGHIESVIISGNVVQHSARLVAGRPINTVFLAVSKSVNGGASSVVLDESCFEYNNQLGSGVRPVASGETVQFRGRVTP
ncbi:hypothetical protein B0E46_01840 [Rhodanobacter sp. B04]|nr:hypothetical protein B0E51_15820 [Rhodanobacter sp. C05]OOG66455.1 hypothetical protein B0E46_01840 [Rhodanobacter sp. B04]